MSKNNKAKPVDRATPVIKKQTRSDSQMVSVARDVTTAAPKNPGWATATDLQAAVKVWAQSADDIEATATMLTSLKTQVRTAEAKQQGFRRTWRAAKKQVLGTVEVVCAGSADEIKAYGLDVRTHAAPNQAISAPDQLATAPGKASGEVIFSWPRGSARRGFLVQHGTDVANPATISAPMACTKSKYTLTGLTPASSVSFRVAAIDPSSPTGQTAWSAWLPGTAR